jgi:TonB-dependent starch-binding outer membrane protein SusC
MKKIKSRIFENCRWTKTSRQIAVFAILSLLIYSAPPAAGKTTLQSHQVEGRVIDQQTGETLPGVNVVEEGTHRGVVTDVNGFFSINVSSPDATLAFSFIGYETQRIPIESRSFLEVYLFHHIESLQEFVVIGYGAVAREDLTGSVETVGSGSFNRGAVVSPQELVAGRISGVNITSSGGAPGSGSTIRIRGGSSLSASNDPLIVIDGVPYDNKDGITGLSNPLSRINPNDIETFTVLKDASATAIYGSRASNGVIIITTKTGRKDAPLSLEYNGYMSASFNTGSIDVLSGDEYRALMNEKYGHNQNVLNLMGDANTNWQNEIFQTGLSHDHNIGITGSTMNTPYRFSFGYTDQEGILRTSAFSRTTGSARVSPSFFDDHLKMNFNVRGMHSKSRFANTGAINAALLFDPTLPVYSGNDEFGGFTTYLQPNGNPITIATSNPVAMLEMVDNTANVLAATASFEMDYTFHFLPELRFNLNMAYDYSESDGRQLIPEYAPMNFEQQGLDNKYGQQKKNSLIDAYFNYQTDIESINSRLNATVGYSWQHFWRENYQFSHNIPLTEIFVAENWRPTEYFLVSFFGRMNYSYDNRYLATFTLRHDGTSLFSEENRWGLFPSVAVAWNLHNEAFMNGNNLFNTLRMRAGYGITGQQNITGNNYPYLPNYTYSFDTARQPFGPDLVTTLRPEGYNANLKWEETTTYNIGVEYGILNDRISGSLEYYLRETGDLINIIPVPAGTNFTNQIITNVGDMVNRGVEFSIVGRPITRTDLFWEVAFNAAYNENEIKRLTTVNDPTYLGVMMGGISGSTAGTIQIHSVGYPFRSFFMYQQIYASDGTPIQGLYADLNEDGMVTINDRYRAGSPAPSVIMGLSSRLNFRQWDFSFGARVHTGNYVYNNTLSNTAHFSYLHNSAGFLNNVNRRVYETNFTHPQLFSDYYLENGSFFKMDYISLGYSFSNLIGNSDIRVYSTVQNPFMITGYSGLDPEIQNGIDRNVYPRPLNVLFGVSMGF